MRKYKFTDVEPYFLGKLANLKKILESGNGFEAAILALCYMDALGNLFMKGTGTKERFLNLTFSYGIVDNFRWDKVNLAEFKKVEAEYELKIRICSACYGKIEQYVDENICQYNYSLSSDCIERDRYLIEVINDITVISKNKTCKCNIISKSLLKCLDDSTYGGILYGNYRCKGVHKGKFDGLCSSNFNRPFYGAKMNEDEVDLLPVFYIPYEFIIKTFEQCLVSLKNEQQASHNVARETENLANHK